MVATSYSLIGGAIIFSFVTATRGLVLPPSPRFRFSRNCQPEKNQLIGSLRNNLNDNNPDRETYFSAIFWISSGSFLLPQLLSSITDPSISGVQRQASIISLLLAKRVYLYSTSFVAMQLAAIRSEVIPNGLGQVTTLNS